MAKKDSNATTLPQTQDLDYLRGIPNDVMSDLSQDDFIMPRYKLIQNTSRAGTPGKFVSNLDSTTELDMLNMIILKITNFRTYFPPNGQGEKPLCRSNDGVVKASSSMIGDTSCKNCRYAQWGTNNGKATPPPCNSGYTLSGIILLPDDVSEIGSISFKKAAIKPCKRYFTTIRAAGVAPFAYITHISAFQEINEKGRFFVPVFEKDPEFLSREAIEAAAMQARQYANIFVANSAEDFDPEASDVVVNDAQSFVDGLSGAPVSDDDIPF